MHVQRRHLQYKGVIYVHIRLCEGFVFLHDTFKTPSLFPQERKLMGSSAQVGSGMCPCGWQAQLPGAPERFRKVPV